MTTPVSGRAFSALSMGCVAVAAALLLAPARDASACYDEPECTLPPPDAWGAGSTPANGGATYDMSYVGLWQSSSADLDAMWHGLGMYKCDWDEGYGYWAAWDLNKPLARLLNAAYLVRIVENRAIRFGLKRQVDGIPDASYSQGYWWQFASAYREDEWEPSCEDGNAIASHIQTTDEWNTVHIPGSYRYGAGNRGSTIIHETTHQDVGHIADGNCLPPSGSCDYKYGEYNPNTMQLNFLHDAILTYQIAPGSNGPVRQVAVQNGTCSFIPWFSASERQAMWARANEIMDRFHTGPPGGWKFALGIEVQSKIDQETWSCECDPSKYVYKPGVCDQTACNEVWHPNNAAVNANNYTACVDYNDTLSAGGLTEETVADAKQTLLGSLESCYPWSPGNAQFYCDQQKAAASQVSEIDQCGWLESAPAIAINKHQCIQLYCREKFEATGGLGWEQNDPFGCLDYFCGGQQCGDASAQEACVFEFMMAHGDPSNYVGNCELAGCKRLLVDCLVPLYQNGDWAYGDPLPEACQIAVTKCKVLSKLATMIFVNYQEIVNPGGPVERIVNLRIGTNPGRNLYGYAEQIRRRAAAGASDAELEDLAEDFTSQPEIAATLYNAAPRKFVSIYGNQGFLEILGPGIENVEPEPFDPAELTPAGAAALAEFNRLLSTLPPGGIKGTIGTFGH